MKRAFDIMASAAALVLLAPLMFLVAILIKLDSPGPVFFRQERMGKGFRPFWIYKFRTMVEDAPARGGSITFGADARITRAGSVLRKFKIDEFPQLINVLKGEMTLVGPRPEVRKYVELFREDYEEILRIRPGITDLASLKYRDEESVLGQCEDPHDAYIRQLLPDKIRLAKEYSKRSSLSFDILLIFKTLLKIAGFQVHGSTFEVRER